MLAIIEEFDACTLGTGNCLKDLTTLVGNVILEMESHPELRYGTETLTGSNDLGSFALTLGRKALDQHAMRSMPLTFLPDPRPKRALLSLSDLEVRADRDVHMIAAKFHLKILIGVRHIFPVRQDCHCN
jgi:hypothetical protein